MEEDSFKTIAASATGEFRDRGSKFIAFAFPLNAEDDWQFHLENVKKDHAKARHHCWAYRYGARGDGYRSNDDSEPSGTAGRPILGQIDSFGLTNVFVVVVRYFGGTLLGTSGLINAYKSSTNECLQNAQIVQKFICKKFRIAFDYALMGEVMNAAKKLEGNIVEQDFGLNPAIVLEIRESQIEHALLRLKAIVGRMSLEEAAQTERLEGLEISPL